MQYTEKLKLKKPDLTDYVNVGDLNDNVDIIDAELKRQDDELADYTSFKDSKGLPLGLAELNIDGKVPIEQLPELGKWEIITDVKLSSNVAQLDFKDLGLEEYRLLRIIYSAKSSADYDGTINVQFNGSNTNIYSSQLVTISGSNVTAASQSAAGFFRLNDALPKNTLDFNLGDVIINNDKDKIKTVIFEHSTGIAATVLKFGVARWSNKTEAITRILFMGEIIKDSTFLILGVR